MADFTGCLVLIRETNITYRTGAVVKRQPRLYVYPGDTYSVSFKYICPVHPFDGAPAEDQENDEMEEQESAPDHQGNMHHPDFFIG